MSRQPRRQHAAAVGTSLAPMLDHDACYRALKSRDPPVRWATVFRSAVTSTELFCRPVCSRRGSAEVGEMPLLSLPPKAAQRRRVPAVPAAAGPRRSRISARGVATSNTVTRGLALVAEGELDLAMVPTSTALAKLPRHRRAPAAAPLQSAPRRDADRGRPVAPRVLRKAAHPRDRAHDGGDRRRVRLRQRAALQRGVPCTLQAPAERVTTLDEGRSRRRHGEAPLSAAVRLGRDDRASSRALIARSKA